MATQSKLKTEAAETGNTDSAAKSYNLVVCAYEGTEAQMAKVWKKMTGVDPTVIAVSATAELRDILAGIIARNDVADEFVFVPANCVPCAPLTAAELSTPLVFVDVNDRRVYGERLPKPFTKEHLVDALAAESDITTEDWLKNYFKSWLTRPIEAGFRFGNLVTPVYRSNPCEHVVIEAFVRKKYIFATPGGYAAISALIDQYLLNG